MSTQVVEFTAPSGLTLTGSLFTTGTDTAVQSNLAATERVNKKGFYTISFTGTLVGSHELIIKSGSNIIGSDTVVLANANGTYQVQSLLNRIEATTQSILSSMIKFESMIILDGSVYVFTSNSLKNSPSGGSNTILVNPIQAIIPERLLTTELYLFNNEIVTQPIGFVDDDGVAIDITGLSFTFKIKDEDGTVVNSQTGITGTGNTVVVTIPAITPGTKCTSWSIRLTSTGKVWRHGPVIFKDVP